MTTYKIERWDAVLGNYPIPRPMIYIKGDSKLEELYNSLNQVDKDDKSCDTQNTLIKVKITDSLSTYDSFEGSALLRSSAEYPIPRPNFFKETGYYVMVINTEWLDYPKNNGNVTILLVEPEREMRMLEGYEEEEDSDDPKTSRQTTKEKFSLKKLDSKELYIILIGFTILIFVLFKLK